MASDRISPTAHYTAHVWYRNGLSHRALATAQGRLLFHALRPMYLASRHIGAPTLEGFLLARHHEINRRLAEHVVSGQIQQVLEVAAGLSPRGWSFKKQFGDRLRYVEADLPEMAARKRALLERGNLSSKGHEVLDLDILSTSGSSSFGEVVAQLDQGKGLAIVTEGLLNYFARDQVQTMWSGFAHALQAFPPGIYLSDLHLRAQNLGLSVDLFRKLLARFVRGGIHLHYANEADAERALLEAGFDDAKLHIAEAQAGSLGTIDDRGAGLVRIIEARTPR
tara:strand:- start:601 stop:1440 length:840 start_codon:yes stop_codon:yes gene_type:complete